MYKLKIPEVILRERQKKSLTQEELAAVFEVSPQSVSNWERGGYPDIVLLPRIASFFGITVDELLGADDASRYDDLRLFSAKWKNADTDERVRLARWLYEKYPKNPEIAEELCITIMSDKACMKKCRPMLREMCELIINESTAERSRINAIEFMCVTATDEEWDKYMLMCSEFYSSTMDERNEERLWLACRLDDFSSQRDANDLQILMHFLGRDYPRYREEDNGLIFAEPAKTAAMMKYRMRIIEAISAGGDIPEAWLGCYADFCLRSAAAMIGMGQTGEGFCELDRALALYGRWFDVPDDALLETGDGTLFGGAKIRRDRGGCSAYVRTADGKEYWTPYLWLFMQRKQDVIAVMNGWAWFDGVRGTDQFRDALEKASRLPSHS